MPTTNCESFHSHVNGDPMNPSLMIKQQLLPGLDRPIRFRYVDDGREHSLTAATKKGIWSMEYVREYPLISSHSIKNTINIY